MKDRVTILGCANASGSHRVKLTWVGKSKKPRCFNNINKTALPVHNMHQKSAWWLCHRDRIKRTFEKIPGCGSDVSSWLDCDADDAGFQLISDDEIIAQVRKPNSDDDNSEIDEDEVIETSKINNSYAFESFAKGLMQLEQQTDSVSTELMLLKQLRERAAKRRQSCLRQSKLPFKPV
ncbi:hypothetical protein AVEN_212188-1 [Araneus ventricosus]|uniref:DDE-1 domain-containing protein n=1 Tax=Araneus ventricosus TaxID=182803 RepID=A0A4Y2TUH5_ARAVE|nr:hypothetical protein AVEN_212188-1 [Araneus ventricosus]